MTYWLVFVVIGLGAGTIMDSPRVPLPVSTQMLHVGNFTSREDCTAAATEASQAYGTGGPGASYRFICIRAANAKMAPPN